MTAADKLRAIAADPHAAVIRQPTARETIEARIGKKLPPTADLPPDLREAIKLLAIQRIRNRQT
jgi:hypothetical protein